MIFTTSEATGLFIFPFLLTAGENAWDIINETGLVFVPFAILLCAAFLESRSQGNDEGAPAILFIKAVEAKALPMLVVVLLGSIPMSSSLNAPSFEFKAYSCAAFPSIIDGVDNVSSLKPNTTMSNYYGNSNASPIFGLVNQLGVALNGAAIASLNCTPGANHNEMAEMLAEVQLSKNLDRKALNYFDNQCYKPAIETLNRLRASGEETTVDFTDSANRKPDAFAYNSNILIKLYDGSIVSPVRDTMRMAIPSYWSDVISTTGTAKSGYITCEEATSDITQIITNDLKNSGTSIFNSSNTYSDNLTKLLSTINTASGNSYTQSEAANEIVKAAYRNSASDWYNPILRTTTTQSTPDVSDRAGLLDLDKYKNPKLQRSAATKGLSFFGAIWSELTKSIETMSYVRLAPTIIVIVQAFILCVAPIVLLLGGYNPKVLLQLVIFYFALAMCPFFMNLGFLIETVLTSLVESQSNGLNIQNSIIVSLVNVSATTIMLGVPMMWLTLIQLLGIFISNSLDGLNGGSQAANATMNDAHRRISDTTRAIGNAYDKAMGEKGLSGDKMKMMNSLYEQAKSDATRIIRDAVNK